jgi:DNA-binding beta-propeller fold protein YncE
MPPLPLTRLLQAALPNLSKPGRAIVSALACLNGSARPAGEVAQWLGLRDRYQLGRMLRNDGLPPLETLAGWARVIYWIAEAEATGASLWKLARREHIDPAVAYRLVRRITGSRWSDVSREGVAALLARLRDQHHTPRATRPRSPHPDNAWRLPLADPPPASPGAQHPAGALVDRLHVGGSPFDVAVTTTGLVLATQLHSARVAVASLEPFRLVGSIPTGAAPTRVIPSASGEEAYVTTQFSEEVGVLDLRTGTQVASIALTGHPLGAARSPDGKTLYVTTNVDRLHAIGIRTRSVKATVPIPMGSPQIAVHPAGHRLYVAGYRSGVVVECDASSLRVSRTFALGGVVQDLVITASGSTLFAANESGWLDVVMLATGRCVARVPLGTAALGLALSHDESLLLVSLVFGGRVAMLDPAAHTLRAMLSPGGKPRLMSFVPGGRAAVVANEAGWIDLIR